MAPILDKPTRASPSVQGSTSGLEGATAPRLRSTANNASTHSNSASSSSPPPPNSSHASQTTQELHHNEPTDQDDTMGPTEDVVAALASDQSKAQLSADYFGPIFYTQREIFTPFVLLWALSVLLLITGYVLMSMLAHSGIVIAQFHKLRAFQHLTYKEKREEFRLPFDQGRLDTLFKLQWQLYLVSSFLTAATFFFLIVFATDGFVLGIPTWFAYILFVISFGGVQSIYWPLSGLARHLQIISERPDHRKDILKSIRAADWREWFYNEGEYVLIFAGSGGHTTEMLRLVKLKEPYDQSLCRRYVITSGDQRSSAMIHEYETQRAQRFAMCGNFFSGTYEIVFVARARNVGQSWLTTPFSAIWCLWDCYRILNLPRPGALPGAQIEFPQIILCNGPGSSAMFVLVAHLMRMYGLMPTNRGVTFFVESVARVCSLSLTGKIFYYLDLADVFVVQHRGVEEVYPDVVCEPMLVQRAYTPGVLPFGWT
ncbi:UDP-N-acetylglucosamine transferase subunit [Pestalotiopsis sp. 9143b]|nr:UDP-N-acetylglucosamine transferase subunit [Pestalotiopsis sp. 9143b]